MARSIKKTHSQAQKNKEQAKQFKRADWRSRKRTDFYNSQWELVSKLFRKSNPLCVHCKEQGVYTLAQCVDHIIPHRGDLKLFWDKTNWQSLCFSCHSKKTAKGE